MDAAGNVYVADTYGRVVYKITPSGTQTTVGKGWVTPAGMAVDAAGDIYVTDDGKNDLYEVTPGGEKTVFIRGLNTPDEVALDGDGNLYFADSYSSKVLKIDRSIPPSLSFDLGEGGHDKHGQPTDRGGPEHRQRFAEVLRLIFPADFRQDSSDDNDCTASTSLSASHSCVVSISFHPVTPLGSKTSVRLNEVGNLDHEYWQHDPAR